MAEGKTIVLITGANSGIGYSTSARAAADPSYHVIMAVRSLEKGEKALSEIKATGNVKGTISLVQLDVTNDETIASALSTVTKEFGRLDVLVNNAGVISFSKDLRTQYIDTFNANTFGPALVTNAFLPLLEKSKNGRIIYITSGLGSIADRVDPKHAWYALPATVYRMSKTALNMLMACHSVEFKDKNIRVWGICPGYVVTNLTGEADRQNRVNRGADSPEVSAGTILSVIEGKRDGDAGKFINKDGAFPW